MPVQAEAIDVATPPSSTIVTARLRRLPPLSSRVIRFDDPQTEERRRVEAFVEATYAKTYGGQVRAHYPTLMSVQDAEGRIYAVVGFRRASEAAPFLEQYLDAPVEETITQRAGTTPRRDQVAEIGNLASDGRGATLFLFLELASHLKRIGCEYAVATATRELRGIFRRAGFPLTELARADAGRLPDGGQSWGAYYSADPVVVAGSIAETLPPLSDFASSVPRERSLKSRLHYADREPS